MIKTVSNLEWSSDRPIFSIKFFFFCIQITEIRKSGPADSTPNSNFVFRILLSLRYPRRSVRSKLLCCCASYGIHIISSLSTVVRFDQDNSHKTFKREYLVYLVFFIFIWLSRCEDLRSIARATRETYLVRLLLTLNYSFPMVKTDRRSFV